MSRYIATRAIRGANALTTEAELLLQKALAEKGSETPVAFPNTAYYLPLMNDPRWEPALERFQSVH